MIPTFEIQVAVLELSACCRKAMPRMAMMRAGLVGLLIPLQVNPAKSELKPHFSFSSLIMLLRHRSTDILIRM